MTIGSTTVQTSGSAGNGATTVFSFSFSVEAYGAVTQASQIEVIKETIATGVETILTLTTDYTTSFNGDQNTSPGGSITMVAAPSSAYKIWIRLIPSFLQATDYQNQGGFLMETVEDQADQQARQILALKDMIRRAPRAGIQAGTSFSGEIAGDLTAGAVPGLKDDLTGFQWYANNGSSTSVTATGSTTARTLATRFAEVGNVKDFGAVGNISTTNDTAAFTAALAVYDAVYVPPGTYRVEGLVVPANKKLFGAGVHLTFLRAGASATYVVSMGASSVLEGMEINGNNLATHGVRVSGVDFVQIVDVSAQYCTNGFYFNDSDTALLHHTASDHNTRGIYVDESFVNCKIIGHVSNVDGYGFYSTYTSQQAQAVRLHQCLFITNTTAGIYFDKDAFVVNITDCIVDECGGNALYFGTCASNTGADVTIQGGYFYSTSPALVVKPTWLHVTAMGAVFSGAQTTQVVQIDATSSTRAENILFKGCRLGSSNAGGKGIAADSPNGLSVEDCDFTTGGSSTDIAIATTYSSGANPLPIIGPNNIFRKGGDPITGSAVVEGNIGYTTRENLTVQEVAFGGTGFALLRGADIASATTTDIGAATGPSVTVTGTTTITGLGTIAAGHRRTVKFSGALLLTYNATSLILPGAANITTAANDTAEFESLGSGNWICNWYKRASGLVLTSSLATDAQSRDTTDTTHALTPANLLNAGVARILWYITGANFNSTSDQAFTKNGTFTNYMIATNGCVRVINPSAAASSAVGGIYTAASKGGDQIVAAANTYASLTGTNTGQNVSAAAAGNALRSDANLYLSLSTPHGSAVTADIYFLGIPLS